MWGLSKRFVITLSFCISMIATGSSHAATYIWDGGGGADFFSHWNNWQGDTFNGSGNSADILQFAGSTRLTPNNDLSAWADWKSVFFNSGASSFTITGNQIDLFDTGGDGKIENNSSVLQSFNVSSFSINSGTYEFNPVSGSLTLGGGGSIFNNGNNIEVWGNNGHTLSIGKDLQNGGGLTVQQNSVVEFTAASSYTGDTIVNAGSVRIAEGGSLGGTIVRVGATSGGNAAGYYISDANGGTTEDTTIVIRNGSSGTKTLGGLNTSGINTFSGTVALDDNVTLSAASGGTMNFSGAISDGAGAGTYGVAINAPGTVRLSGSGANSGQSSWTLQSGTLELNKSTTVNAINSAGITIQSGGTMRNLVTHQISDLGNVTIQSGGAWDLNSFSETINSLSLASGSSLSLGTAQLIVDNQANGTWAGTIAGSSGGSIVKKGANTISVTGDNSGMAGTWFVVGGIVGFNHNNAAGSGTINLGETFGADAATIDISSGGVNVGNNIIVRSGSSGTKTIDNASGGSITFSGGITLNANVVVSAGSGETTTMSGNVGGVGKIQKTGDGTLTLGGNNNYTGNTEIDAGTLNVSGDLSGSYIYIGNGGNSSAATLELSGSGSTLGGLQVNTSAGSGARTINVTAGSHTMSGSSLDVDRAVTINASGGSLNIAHTVNLDLTETGSDEMTINSTGGSVELSGGTAIEMGSNRDLGVTGSGNTTISGAISASSGAAQINKSGSGTLTISGNNSASFYMLNIAGGTVAMNGTAAFGSQSVSYADKINFNSSGTLQITGNSSLNNNMGIRVASGQTGTLNVNNGVTFSVGGALAVISGSGTYTKTGAGTLEITGNSTFTGTFNQNQGITDVQNTLNASSGINVNGGTLNVDGTAGNVTMNGGTLTGSGGVGTLVVGNGSTLSPGNSPGTIFAGNTTWDNGGTYLWEINDAAGTAGADPGWDLLDVTGTLTINAGFTIDVTSLTGLVAGDAANFDGTQDYVGIWLLAQTTGGLLGSPLSPTINLAGFSNPYSGNWYLSTAANGLYLNYEWDGQPLGGGGGPSAVPEPNTLSLAMLAGLLLFSLRYHIKKSAKPEVAVASVMS